MSQGNLWGGYFPEQKYNIEVLDNVFIGANTTIVGNVRIGPNAVVGAGSLVNKDVPEGKVYAGVPAREIGTFADLVEKRMVEDISVGSGSAP